MKYFILCMFLLVSSALYTYACNITLSTDKKTYSLKETAIITVTVDLTHRNCTRESLEPAFSAIGADITAKTPFKKNAHGLYEIKYKIVIKDKKTSVTVDKFCPKGGDKQTLTLFVQ